MEKPPSEKSQFRLEIEGLAESLGYPDADTFLKEYREGLLESSNFPTEDCIEPHEIERYKQGEPLSENSEKHVQGCTFCSLMRDAVQPNE